MKTFELLKKRESETLNRCQCFKNPPQFAATSESERMYVLLKTQKCALATSEMANMDMLCKNLTSEANVTNRVAQSPCFNPFP